MIFLQQIAEVLPYHLSIYLKYFDVIPGWPDPSINGIKLTTLRFVPHMAWKINGTFRSQVASPETGAWDPSCSQAGTPGTKPGTGELGIGWGLRKGKNQWESHIHSLCMFMCIWIPSTEHLLAIKPGSVANMILHQAVSQSRSSIPSTLSYLQTVAWSILKVVWKCWVAVGNQLQSCGEGFWGHVSMHGKRKRRQLVTVTLWEGWKRGT